MHKSKIDLPVLMLFFNRPEHVRRVFEQVKIARPSRLYLYQDGAREGREDDIINVQKCREAVSDIDWECEVHTHYCEKNYGCDPSEYLAQKWMFETEEMGIVLEDDDVPSQSFFPFCKELLEKYKDDTRINMICGMNNTGISKHISDSYLFTKKGSIWGWASWRRVLDSWDGNYTWLGDPEKLEIIKKQLSADSYENFIKKAKQHAETGREHYESINAAACYIYDRLNIVPKYNMICNIGIGLDTTHGVSDIRLLPRRIQKLMHMKTYEIEFPLKHPDEVKRDFKFEKRMSFSKLERFFMRIESAIRSVIYQGPKGFIARLNKKLKKR